jgi:hypothetical protein
MVAPGLKTTNLLLLPGNTGAYQAQARNAGTGELSPVIWTKIEMEIGLRDRDPT